MSDATPIADVQKPPPPDAPHTAADANKPTDATAKTATGGDQAGTSNWLMSEVHQAWDGIKQDLGLSSSTKSADTRPSDTKPADTKLTDTAPADTKPADTKLTDTAPADTKPADTKSANTKTADTDTSLYVPSAIEASAGKPVPAAASAPAEQHWWDGIVNAGSSAASFVENGWNSLSDTVTDSYKSIVDDSDNKTTHVEAIKGADGKPDYFQSQSDNGTRTLTADEARFTDTKGATIIKNTKTGEITSQSADGEDIYTRKADGTEIYRSKNVEYTKTADGKYEARDDKGDVTEVSDKGAITKIDGFFKVAQRITTIDANTAKPEKGQLETMTDGQRYMDRLGNVIVARDNGVREITTTQGQHYRLDQDHHQVEIEENGNWRALTNAESEQFQHSHVGKDGQVHNSFEVNGVRVDPDGKVSTAEKVTLGQTTPDGKMAATVPTTEGKPATVVNNPDHTSTLELNGHVTKVNPDDKTHLVERFSENPDGSLGASDFCYNSADQSFWTPDLQWNQNGTQLDWNDMFVDPNGSIMQADGTTVFDDAPDAIQSSSEQSQQLSLSADNDISTVTSKIGSQSLDSGDLAVLDSSLSDLNGALTTAMTSANFSAACQIITAKEQIETAMAEASQQVAQNDLGRSNSIAHGDTVAANDQGSPRGGQGAAFNPEAPLPAPGAHTFEGKLAYMSEFGISGLPEDQEQRMTAW